MASPERGDVSRFGEGFGDDPAVVSTGEPIVASLSIENFG
jgi:hypothetical protein